MRSFFVHLDELRARILKAGAVFILAACVAFSCADRILPWIIKPAGHLVFTAPAQAFGAHVTIAVVLGLVISFPFILYQIWAFVAAALKPDERRFIAFFGPLSLVFFLLGVGFAFFAAVPMAYRFLMGFSDKMPLLD